MTTDWTLTYDHFDPEEEGLREALCTLGNGLICTRGAAEWADADDVHYPGTYLAGGYNRLTTEMAGRPVVNEDLVNFPNWLCLTFRIDDGPWFSLADVTLKHYRQELDTHDGILTRDLRFVDAQGRETSLFSRRMVSQAQPHRAGIAWDLTAHGWSGTVTIRSALDGTVVNWGVPRYRELESHHLDSLGTEALNEQTIFLMVRTNQSGLVMAQAARTIIAGAGEVRPGGVEKRPGYIAQEQAFDITDGQTARVEKTVAIFSSRDRALSEPGVEARTWIGRLADFEVGLRKHISAWHQHWRHADLRVDADGEVQMIIRVHIFHLLQTMSRNSLDLDVGVPARGLHGEAYRGHVFWDEIYIFPFLNNRLPEITRAGLLYRFRRLGEARELALASGYAGAMFPWQSGSNGQEETQTVHLNPESGRWIPDLSHNQRHVSAAIAYNVWQFVQATLDMAFLTSYGAQMLCEIARFWASIAHRNNETGRFEIHGVMGPDEYHEMEPGRDEHGLRNNAYTNVMVAWIMEVTLEALNVLEPVRRSELRESLEITDAELELWDQMSRKMFVPFHGNGIISQFQGYENLKELDWDAYRAKYDNIQRMDRILEAEGDNADDYKVSKQADVLMLFYLFSADRLTRLFARLGYALDADIAKRNIDYYMARTSHGSTLSNVVHAAVLAPHDLDRAWAMYMKALQSDVRDIQGGTTREGIHLGAMAGTADLLQRGFMGQEDRDGVLLFNPTLPQSVRGLAYCLHYRGRLLDVTVDQGTLILSLGEGSPAALRVGVGDAVRELLPGQETRFAL
ncbi:MAG: glycoside hydrolase family 65 protein [Rhodobacterales bacterium]|nr:glycoside hydrolase family 65 protein [Rhodobacterales bacterium]